MDTVETRTPPDGGSAGGPGYDGFISYSHSADDLLAPRLQMGLQRFAKPWWKRRAVRIFRDETSLSASPHLWSSITQALDASEWFILLMSPTAAASDWVDKEVEYWLEHKSADRILPVLTDGSFRWEGDDFDSDAAPPALHGAFFEDPRWVDLRFARSDEQLDLKNPQFSAAVADIASAIRGVPKDELESEEVRQHRRTTRTAWGAALLLFLFATAALVAAAVAVNRSAEAERQRDEATRQAELALTRELVAHAGANLEIDPERSVLLALEALELGRSSGGEALTEVEDVLARSVEAMRTVATVPGSTMSAGRDGLVVVTADDTGTVRLWEKGILGAFTEAPGVAGVDSFVGTAPVAVSGDGRAVAYLSPVITPIVVDAASGETIAVLEGHTEPVISIVLNDDATRAHTVGVDFTTRLWNVEDASLIRSAPADSNGGAFSADGRLVGYGAYSESEGTGSVFIWDAATGADVATVCCHQGSVLALAFGPGATTLASVGFADGSLRLWDVGTGEQIWSVNDPSGQFGAVAISADGALVATGSTGGTVRLWDARNGDPVMVLSGHSEQVTSVAFAREDGLYSAAHDGQTRLWNIGSNRPGVIEFIAYSVEERPTDDAFITLSFNPAGDRLVTTVGHDAARLWNLADLSDPIELSPIQNLPSVFMGGAFSPDGAQVAIGGVDNHPRVFDAVTGELLMTLEDNDSRLHRGVAFSPDSKRLVTGGSCCDPAPNGAPKIWDLTTGGAIRLEHSSNTWEVAWSPDGHMIATAGDDATRIWDAATAEERYALSGPFVGAVRFSPDGRLLATGGLEGAALWDAATGAAIVTFEGHAGPVTSVAFSPDGTQLVSGGFDTLAKIWDVETGVESQTLTEHPRAVTGVSWSSDGTIATVSDLGDVRLHIRDLDALERIARERVTRSLIDAECRQYLHIEACSTK